MGKRDPYLVERDLDRYRKRNHNHFAHLFPALENTPDINRYQMRLAAEVATTVIRGNRIDPDQAQAFEAARHRAFEILGVLAKG